MKTILVPVDLSAATKDVIAVAGDLARSLRGRLVVLHVMRAPPVKMNSYGFAVAEVREMMAALEKRSARRLLFLGRRCEKFGRPVRTVLGTGEPAALILAEAKARGADFVVLGSHGHSAAYDLFIGSTTQAVLRKTNGPVLVVPVKRASPTRRSRGKK